MRDRVEAVSRQALARIGTMPDWVQLLAAVLLLAFYASRIATVYRDTGLFRRIGFDWGLFFSQASALAAGDVAAMYQLDRLVPYLQRLAQYTTTPNVPLLQWPSPYPPLFAGGLAPLTFLPPPLAFGIWTALSVAAAVHLVWRINQLLPATGVARLALLVATALPVVQVLVLGQPMLFLASAIAESLVALNRGADFRGGLWLGLLAIKPQYGLVLGLFLLWKRRWSAVLGAALTVAVVLAASAVLAGPGALLDYQRAVSAMGEIRDPYAVPAEMINWRALIVNLRPAIGGTTGIMLFLALAGLTVLALAWATRGAWRPNTPTLDLQLAVVLVTTMLVSYHSHMHGLVLLAVPLALAWRAASAAPRLAILALVLVPTIIFVLVTAGLRGMAIDYELPLWVVWPPWTIALLILLNATLFLELRSAPVTAPVRATASLSVARNA
jgi:alpha-1,2-mannosyltransferase